MAETLLEKKFDDFESGADSMKKYFEDNFHPVKSNGRITVAQFNSKIRADGKKILAELPGDATYSVRYFGQFKACTRETDTGKYSNRQHYSRGLPVLSLLCIEPDRPQILHEKL